MMIFKKFKFYIILVVLFSLVVGSEFVFNAKQEIFDLPKIEVLAEEEIDIPERYCLRDEYFLLTTNQHGQGLCWNFASSSVFSTAVMKSTNQYIDYSEGWISEAYAHQSTYYNPGDGGSFGGFDSAMRKNGIVQEQDFNYEESYQVSKENVNDMHEYFSQYADTVIGTNYRTKSYSVSHNADAETQEYQRNLIKKHLLTQSGFYVSFGWSSASAMYNGQKVYFKNPTPESTSGGHALTVVGWDDNIEITYNNVKYKGAWIFLNSWGNSSGNQGMFYIFYDDKQVSYFNGYEYIENYDDLYFFNKLVDSSADFKTEVKGAYTGSFEKSTADTKQKNIFTSQNDVSLTYSYKISPNTSLDKVEIYNFQEDVTDKFIITNDSVNNLLKIDAKEQLDLSTYKVVFTYSNNSKTEKICGAFSIINGTETEYINVNVSPTSTTNLNFNLQGVSPLNNGVKSLTTSTTQDTGTLSISCSMAMYSSAIQAKVFDSTTGDVIKETVIQQIPARYISINFNYNLTNTNHYIFTVYGLNGSKTWDVYILKINPEEQVHARINYTLFGGVNNEDNHKASVISKTQPTILYNPTKNGYGFTGWFYSSDYSEQSRLKNFGDEYYFEFDKISHYDTYSVYWAKYDEERATLNFYNFVIYAKWVKLEDNVTYYKISSSVNGNGKISDVGIIYVPEHSNKVITISTIGYNVSQIYIDGILINETFYPSLIQKGIEFNNIVSNHSFVITFVPRTDIKYYVCHWVEALDTTSFEFNGEYYQSPIIETFNGRTDELTNATPKAFTNFVVLPFEQMPISSQENTIINIFYNREIYNISVSFTGLKADEEDLDVNESVKYGESRTYNLCPEGYLISECKIDGQVCNLNSVTFDNICNNHIIEVTLQVRTYYIAITQSEHGNIYCKGTLKNIDLGEIRTFTVIANSGYKIKEVKVNGQVVELDNNGFSILINKDYVIEAEYEQVPISEEPGQEQQDDNTGENTQGGGTINDNNKDVEPKGTDNQSIGFLPIIFIVSCIGVPALFMGIVFAIKKRRMSY